MNPSLSEVIPFCPEPIVNRDGTGKNDCERNAFYRFLAKLIVDHPKLSCLLIMDSLYSVGPIIRAITKYSHLRYIIGAKPGDHKYLFELVGRIGYDFEKKTSDERGVTYHYSCTKGVPLNESNQDIKVDFVKVILET